MVRWLEDLDELLVCRSWRCVQMGFSERMLCVRSSVIQH
jgi:hypothetical protein